MIDLYRLRDARGRLLYVGISFSAIARASAHRSDKGWWSEVARMDVEHLDVDDYAAAEQIEAETIKRERPRYNVVHNNGRTVAASPRPRGPRMTREQWIALEARDAGLIPAYTDDRTEFSCMHRRRVWLSTRQYGWSRCTAAATQLARHPEFGLVALCSEHTLREVDPFLRRSA